MSTSIDQKIFFITAILVTSLANCVAAVSGSILRHPSNEFYGFKDPISIVRHFWPLLASLKNAIEFLAHR